jgi:NADP-dependent 3-hydroxy acid dehydrogenase YdfG
MKALEGRTALVTGASSGIGAACARMFAGEGARVLLVARRRERLEQLAREMRGMVAIEADVRDPKALRAALAAWPIDIALAGAGLARGVAPLQEGEPDEWSEVIDTNVKGVLNTIRAVTPGMIERRHGDVVLLGSVAGRQVYPGGAVYCASKFAVHGLYQAMRLDLHDKGIRCTTVDPGMVKTEFSDVRFGGDHARAEKVYAGVEYLTPEDIADIVRYVVTRPRHVNIGEVVVWASAQASTTMLARRPS